MYFEKEGPENTTATVQAAIRAAKERNIQHIVVASTTGATAKLFLNETGLNVVAVTLPYGWRKPGESEISDATRNELTKSGIKVLSTTLALSGGEKGLSSKFGGVFPLEIVAHSLKLFGQGTKVAIEIAVSALDSGLIPFGKPVISIAGSRSGADTAIVVVPSYSASLLETRVREVIAKPY